MSAELTERSEAFRGAQRQLRGPKAKTIVRGVIELFCGAQRSLVGPQEPPNSFLST